MTVPTDRPAPVSLRESFFYWLKLGCIGFGGPAGQIAIMHADLVERRRWISEARFLHALNFCMLLPGPEAQQLATYIGWLMHRRRGALIAGGLFVLPSLLLLIGLSWVYLRFGSLPAVAAVLWGIKPAVVAIVLAAAWRIGSRTLKHPLPWAIAAAAFVAIAALQVPFPAVVFSAALAGLAGAKFVPQAFAGSGGHAGGKNGYGPALIDDDTPVPAHARRSPAQALQVLAAFVAIWSLALGGLTLAFGWQGGLTQIGWFFTKAALLTFGGAYAVLPYVFQGAVGHYGWLDAAQMIDGLALGETTPGPLIMVVAFVGFVGGWTKALFGPDAQFAAAVAGATVATFFTFLPSFLFILVGAPFIEGTRGQLRFTAPLAGIAAAVVGVILSLALFFAGHVFWPTGLGGHFDLAAAAISAAALLALQRYRLGTIPTIAACAALGLAWRLLPGLG